MHGMALVSFGMFRKNLGNLREFFGQMVHRPPGKKLPVRLCWLANSMLFFGWAVGAIVLGIVSDRYGRRKVLFPSLFFVVVMSFAMAFAEEYWIVAACRVVVGFFEAGCFISMFVLATELVGPGKRALAWTLVWSLGVDLLHSGAPTPSSEGLLCEKLAYVSDIVVCTIDGLEKASQSPGYPQLQQVTQ